MLQFNQIKIDTALSNLRTIADSTFKSQLNILDSILAEQCRITMSGAVITIGSSEVQTLQANGVAATANAEKRGIAPVASRYATIATSTLDVSSGAVTGDFAAAPSGKTMTNGNYVALGFELRKDKKWYLIWGTEDAVKANTLNSTNTPVFSNTSVIKKAIIILQKNGAGAWNFASPAVADMITLPTGGGAGGTGDASDIVTRIQIWLDSSSYREGSSIAFSVDEDTKVDTGNSTGTYDVANQAYALDSTEIFRSVGLLDSSAFGSDEQDIDKADVALFYSLTSLDSTPTVALSRDGGVNFQTVTVAREQGSDVLEGSITFTEEANVLLDTKAVGGGTPSTEELNASTVQLLATKFTTTVPKVFQELELYLTKTGSPTGSLIISLVRDSSGSPSTSAADIVSSASVDISTLSAGNNTVTVSIPSTVRKAGTYWVRIETDATYKSIFSTGVTAIAVRTDTAVNGNTQKNNGTAWSALSTEDAYFAVRGRLLDLRLKVTASATSQLVGAGVLYGVDGVYKAADTFQPAEFTFSGDENKSTFTLPWLPVATTLNMYDAYEGKVYPGRVLSISNYTVTVPTGLFDRPGVDCKVIFKADTAVADSSDTNANRILTIENKLNTFDITQVVTPVTIDTGSTPANNPYGLVFNDAKPRWGIERVMIGGIQEIPTTDFGYYDAANGKRGYYAIDARTGLVDKRIRFYGAWILDESAADIPTRTYSSTTGDYLTITDIMTSANVLSMVFNTNRNTDNSIYVDGVDTTQDISQVGSAILIGNYWQVNQPQVASTSLTQGVHTVKIVVGANAGTDYFMLQGVEILNEHATNMYIPAGTVNINGFDVSMPLTTRSYKGAVVAATGSELYTGTKGARHAIYADANGNYISKIQSVLEVNQTGTAAYNAGSSDTVTGLSDVTPFYANSQGNIVRVRDNVTTAMRMMLVPSGGGAGVLTFANDYDGVANTTLFSTSTKQFQDNGTSASVIGANAVTVELYGKVLANTDHTDEEVYQDLHWRQFSDGNANDFSQQTTSSGNRGATLDDGSCTFVGNNLSTAAIAAENIEYLRIGATTGTATFTFFGSGCDISYRLDGAATISIYIDGLLVSTTLDRQAISKLCSNLPLGYHTIRFVNTSGSTYGFLERFLVYRPKTKALTGAKLVGATNILADQVLTNLPTRNLASENWAIDQGMIRKHTTREVVYTGAATWAMLFSSAVAGPYYNYLDLAGEFTYTVFGSGKFRTHIQNGTSAQASFIKVDGSTVETYTAAATTMQAYISATSTMGSLGRHTVQWQRSNSPAYAGNFFFYALDYYTPTYEPQVWTMNPHKEKWIGGSSIATPQPVNASRSFVLEYANQTGLSSGVMVKMVGRGIPALDPGVYKIDVSLNFGYIWTSTAPTIVGPELDIIINGTAYVVYDSPGKWSTDRHYGTTTWSREVIITKRSALEISALITTDGTPASSGRFFTGPTLIVTKVG